MVKPDIELCAILFAPKDVDPVQLKLTVFIADELVVVLNPSNNPFNDNDGRYEQLLK